MMHRKSSNQFRLSEIIQEELLRLKNKYLKEKRRKCKQLIRLSINATLLIRTVYTKSVYMALMRVKWWNVSTHIITTL